MHAQHVLRTLCLLGDLVDVQIGGVGSQHRARFCKLVELTKHFLLDCHGFEYGFDDQIRVLDVLKADHTVDQIHALGGTVRGDGAPPTRPAAASGAANPRAGWVVAATALVKIERSALAAASLLSSSRNLRSGRFSASTFRAKASPPDAGPSTISSIRPFFNASLAPIGSPPTIILTASSGPTARGRRCVPPAPGNRPSFTSGRPSLASLVATRKWQASATSRPPPSAVP